MQFRYHVISVILLLASGLISTSSGRAQAPVLSQELEQVRAALDKYQDPYVAVRDGYFSTLGCVHYPNGGGHGRVPYPAGGMGVHFLNPQLIGPKPDPMHPAILVFEPDGNKLKLVAVEWFIPLETGIKERPALFDHPFDGPMEGHEPLIPLALHHYDLHAWLWKTNAAGLFSPTNPAVNCSGYAYSLAEDAPHLVSHPQH